jgi:hypothetical protein
MRLRSDEAESAIQPATQCSPHQTIIHRSWTLASTVYRQEILCPEEKATVFAFDLS